MYDFLFGAMIFILLNLFEDYNQGKVPPCPEYCMVEHEHINPKK